METILAHGGSKALHSSDASRGTHKGSVEVFQASDYLESFISRTGSKMPDFELQWSSPQFYPILNRDKDF